MFGEEKTGNALDLGKEGIADPAPTTGTAESIVRTLVRPTRAVSALLGFLLKVEVDSIFRQPSFQTTDGTDPRVVWRKFSERSRELTAVATLEIESLPQSLGRAVQEISARKTFKAHYEAIAEYTFAQAPIESLVTPQWHADLDYIDELAQRINPGSTLEERLAFAMPEGRILAPIVAGNQVTFTSPRRDLFADPIPTVRETDGGDIEIVVRAASRPNYVQVVKLGDRLILSNGVHKVCAMHTAGFTHCPCVFRTVNRFEEIGIMPWGTFRSETIAGGERLAMVTDLLNPEVAVPLKMDSTYQIMQIAVNVGQMSVPAPIGVLH
jgi:hypothetical protein